MKRDMAVNCINTPNPMRVAEVIARILGRRYGCEIVVKEIKKKDGEKIA